MKRTLTGLLLALALCMGLVPGAMAAAVPSFDLCNGQDVVHVQPVSPTWSNTGYTFSGWYTRPNGQGALLAGTPSAGATYYAHWVSGGKTVRTTPLVLERSTEEQNDAQGWTWSDNVLTLSGTTIHTHSGPAISLPDGSTLRLTESSVNNAFGGESDRAFGVYCAGSLFIDGSGSLYAKSAASGDQSRTNLSAGIYAETTLTVMNGSLLVVGGPAAFSIGLGSNGVLNILGGTLSATGGEAANSRGISGSAVTISGGAHVMASAFRGSGKLVTDSIGLFGSSVAINGGTLRAIGGDALGGESCSSCGILGVNGITITGGTVEAQCGNISAGTACAMVGNKLLSIGSAAQKAAITGAQPVWVDQSGYGTVAGARLTQLHPSDPVKIFIVSCKYPDACPSAIFADLDQSAWYHEAIDYACTKGMMQGVGSDEFMPQGTMTRDQIVTMLWRLTDKPVVNYLMQFEDVPEGQWYSEAIRWAASEQIVNGYSAVSFGPRDAITREQMAAILHRYAKHQNYDMSAGDGVDLSLFADGNTIRNYAVEAMEWAVGSGILSGSDGHIRPAEVVTRADAADMLMRFCEHLIK